MKQTLVYGRPPMFAAIDAVLKVAGKPVFFSWGKLVYAEHSDMTLTPELVAHEAVHGERQIAMGVENWWQAYLTSPAFRLAEEVLAHQAEFISLCEQHQHKWVSKRAMRRTLATYAAKRLAAPLYGGMITVETAKKILLGNERDRLAAIADGAATAVAA